MLRIFIGYDPRQPVAAQVLAHSIYHNASVPVSITFLTLKTLPIERRGLTEFTFSRYLCPYLCGFHGRSLFLDADMLVTGDIAELFALGTEDPVCVVKNRQRFEWPSMMLFNNEKCQNLTPEFIESQKPQLLEWAESIGSLPSEWNHCVGYDEPRSDPKLIHFTAGIPVWPETKDSEHAGLWQAYFMQSNSTVSHEDLMGTSVHVRRAA